jgi:hypothetical protein
VHLPRGSHRTRAICSRQFWRSLLFLMKEVSAPRGGVRPMQIATVQGTHSASRLRPIGEPLRRARKTIGAQAHSGARGSPRNSKLLEGR